LLRHMIGIIMSCDCDMTLCGVLIGDGFIDRLFTRLGTTSNYSATANLHNSQTITAPAKPFSSLLCLHQPFPGNGFHQWRFFSCTRSGPPFTAARAEFKSLSTELITPTVLVLDSRHGPHKKHRSSIVAFLSVTAGTCLPSCFPETYCLTSSIKNLLTQQRVYVLQ
jgi:hypothetical protein